MQTTKSYLLRSAFCILASSFCLLAGCEIPGVMLQAAVGEPAVSAQYKPQNVPTLILVENYDNPDEMQIDGDQIAHQVGDELAKEAKLSIVDPDKLAPIREEDPTKFRNMTIPAIGLAVGGGLYLAAVASTAIILTILAGIKPLEERVRNSRKTLEIRLRSERGAVTMPVLDKALGWRAIHVKGLTVRPADDDPAQDDVAIDMSRLPLREVAPLLRDLRALTGVTRVEALGDTEPSVVRPAAESEARRT